MVEFHRFGRPQNILSSENRYIRTTGWDAVAREVSPSLDHEDLLRSLNALRYGSHTSDAQRQAARERLATEAARLLEPVVPGGDELLQLDLVSNAAELWAFPFESCFAHHQDWLSDANRGVVVTRRIRGDFSANVTPWPVVPRVLFAHAPIAADLEQSLVNAHVSALTRAFEPWARGKKAKREQDNPVLSVREVASVQDLARFRNELQPTHVHVLAHGAPTPPDPGLPQREIWGLRLGYEGEPGAAPVDVADALQPLDGLPVVVTFAACDSANQMSPAFGVHSVVQELHGRGVPVVVGSQLPLTKAGSHVFTRAFYEPLLQAEDVRAALHAARVHLYRDASAGHDWLSLVGYVRLPPDGYAAYLDEVGLRVELRLLDTAQARADALSTGTGGLDDFTETEQLVKRRLDSLKARRQRIANRKDLLEESSGLEASAYKRLAELLFIKGLRYDDTQSSDWRSSRQALEQALDAYRNAYQADLHSHWLGVQQLALEAALTGRIARAEDWALVTRAAQIARDAAPKDGKRDCWSCGTLTELALLAPFAQRPRDLDAARQAAALLTTRAREADDEFPIASTRRQIERYVRWWTSPRGFFPDAHADLSADAAQLLHVLT
jgi:hypothetical protein